jgi:hypothetical protein
MPKGLHGQKRPADVIGNAVKVMRIATGEIQEVSEHKNVHAAIRHYQHARCRIHHQVCWP